MQAPLGWGSKSRMQHITHPKPDLILPKLKRPNTTGHLSPMSPEKVLTPQFTAYTPRANTTDAMEIDLQPISTISQNTESCPCGHLHGAGQGDIHDVYAVGLSDRPLFRGP